MDKILDEHCRAAGASASQVAPMLNAAEIAELREFAEKMPYVSRIRKEFMDAARQAEHGLQQREAGEAARLPEQSRTHYPSLRASQESPSHTTTPIERLNGDSL
jgi:hypothetical protein